MKELQRCDCGVIKKSAVQCHSCGRGFAEVDPITQLRRRARDLLNKAPIDKVIKVVEILGVK